MMFDTFNTPTLCHAVESQLPGVPAMLKFKFEIPGFEGWKPAEGKRTDHIRKILTHQDAIVLIMDAMIKLKQSRGATGSIDLNLCGIRQLMRQWRKPTSMLSARSPHSDWTSTYFNVCYGFVGSEYSCTRIGPCEARLCNSKSRSTYWHRTSRGHYALTYAGECRVTELERIRNSLSDVPTMAASQESPTMKTAPIKTGICGAVPSMADVLELTVTFKLSDSRESINEKIFATKINAQMVVTPCTSKVTSTCSKIIAV